MKQLVKKIINRGKPFLIGNYYRIKHMFKSVKLTIVTTSYESAEYLDDYFESIFNSHYPKKNMQIVFVDDGSTDDTKAIVEKWQAKHPQVIEYYYQENAGQAAARNFGISKVKYDWVTFIDSDDFVSEKYFKQVAKGIKYSNFNSIVAANVILYNDENGNTRNTHPLRYRFNQKESYRNVSMLTSPNDFQFQMATAFYSMEIIKKYQLQLKDIKPHFEDAMFIFDYLLASKNYNICFAKNPKYYYRKRAAQNSTLNLSGKNKRRYVEMLSEAYIQLIKNYKDELGYLPMFVQNAIYYDLNWNFRELETNEVPLTATERKKREQYMQEIFNDIDFQVLINNVKYMWYFYIIGFNARYYGNQYPEKAVANYYYETNDWIRYQLVSYDDRWKFVIDGKEVTPEKINFKKIESDLNGEKFVELSYITIQKPFTSIELEFDGVQVPISAYNENFVEKHFNEESNILLFDRIGKADDNAEAFYTWMMENHPEYKNINFVISSQSDDWARLEAKGFNLIDYGTAKFNQAYINADYILSSALDAFIENRGGHRYQSFRSRAKFIFLQHGVTVDDMTEWFNKKRVDKIVTLANFEYENLATDYLFTRDQVLLTGFPRYDLLTNNPDNVILLQLTWRREYVGMELEEFLQTPYAQKIIKVMTDEKLKAVLREKDYVLKYFPHPAMNHFVELFEPYRSDVVDIINTDEIIYREQFAKAKLQITDYSSVFADFAYLMKPVIYYQDDAKHFFANHLYKPKMSYKQQGLGPVVESHDALITEIIKSVENDCVVESKYQKRIEKFFAYRDQNNCQRLFDELRKY